MKLNKPIILSFSAGVLITLVVLYLLPLQYKLHQHIDLKSYSHLLQSLGKKSILTKDVPVAALLVYNDSIIGEGFNTVYRDTEPAGHAEINAIHDCLKRFGFKQFNALDRTKLKLISTFEPCQMCRGAMEEYNIKECIFDLPKTLNEKNKAYRKELILQYKMKETGNGRLQYELFKLHPDFDSIKYPF